MRNEVIMLTNLNYAKWSLTPLIEAQRLADAFAPRLHQERVAQRDVARAQAPVPEEDGLVVALAAGLHPRDDLSQLRVQVVLVEAIAVHVLAQRAERQSLAALAP